MKDSQGHNANEHGEKLREAVAGILVSHGFENVGPVKVDPARISPLAAFGDAIRNDLRRPDRAFAADVPVCYHFHGSPFEAQFLLFVKGWPGALALFARGQKGTGSAAEKLEFLYANIAERFPPKLRAVVLLDGKGFLPVLERARLWVERSEGRIAQIIPGLSPFRQWLTEGCAFPEAPSPSLVS